MMEQLNKKMREEWMFYHVTSDQITSQQVRLSADFQMEWRQLKPLQMFHVWHSSDQQLQTNNTDHVTPVRLLSDGVDPDFVVMTQWEIGVVGCAVKRAGFESSSSFGQSLTKNPGILQTALEARSPTKRP